MGNADSLDNKFTWFLLIAVTAAASVLYYQQDLRLASFFGASNSYLGSGIL